MKRKMFFRSLAAVFVVVLLGCTDDSMQLTTTNRELAPQQEAILSTTPLPGTGTYYGRPVSFNNATVQSFVTLNNYAPTAIGYRMTNTIYNTVPSTIIEAMIPMPPLPQPPNPSPDVVKPEIIFDHLMIDIYPQGSPPAGIFTFPKFDFHVYTISEEERMSIDSTDAEILVPPPAGYLPDYLYGPTGPISYMGSHWVDLLSPEFNGGQFTKTFIYGTYNAKIVFQEMSATIAYLKSASAVKDVANIRLPAKFDRYGYYPTKYRFQKDATYTYAYFSDFTVYLPSRPIVLEE